MQSKHFSGIRLGLFLLILSSSILVYGCSFEHVLEVGIDLTYVPDPLRTNITIELSNTGRHPVEVFVWYNNSIEQGRNLGVISSGESYSFSEIIYTNISEKDIIIRYIEEKDDSFAGCKSTSFSLCRLASEKPSMISCMMKKTIEEQNFCAAERLHDTIYCNETLFFPEKIKCLAFVEDDHNLCSQLVGGWKDWCISDYATNNDELILCDSLFEDSKKRVCTAVISDDSRSCLELDAVDAQECIIKVADRTGNRSLCGLLEDSSECNYYFENYR